MQRHDLITKGSLILLGFLLTFSAYATTEEELMNPDHWQEMQRQSNGVGKSGKHIKDRALYCLEQKKIINAAFSRSAHKVWGFSIFKENGFMAMPDIQRFERKLRNASEFGYKQINRAMHNGANIQECDYHRVDAIDSMNCIMSILPDFVPVVGGREFSLIDCRWQLDPSRP